MAKKASRGSTGRKHQLFARRQVYLRSGQDSQYVELSPMLQIGVALGFGALALWLIGASYGAVMQYMEHDKQQALMLRLDSAQQALLETERQRDSYLIDAARVADLEDALMEAEAELAEANDQTDAAALTAELEQSRSQIEDLQHELSEARADQAALQARYEAEALATDDASDSTAQEVASLHDQLEKAFAEIETLKAEKDRIADAGDQASEEAANLESQLQTAHAEIETLKAERDRLAAAGEEVANLESQLETARAEMESVQAERDRLAEAEGKAGQQVAELGAELETAVSEIAALKEERDATAARLQTLGDEKTAQDEAFDRNAALLKAATAEIERLQEGLARADSEAEKNADVQTVLDQLRGELKDMVAARDQLERETADLRTQLADTQAVVQDLEEQGEAAETDRQIAVQAAIEEQTSQAEARETDLLSEIDELRLELKAVQVAAADQEEDAGRKDAEEIEALRERVAIAESEIEQLILSGLKANDPPAETPAPAPVSFEAADTVAENQRLRSELLAAQADIIKLNADVKAAKQRLADQTTAENGQASRPDNSAKLEQQLASSRSRVQQLNRALADAKLREVAIDLALINVVPTPSPPAPR